MTHEEETLAVLKSIAKSRPLSLERAVAAVIMLIVLGACSWVGNTMNSLSHEMIKLQSDFQHQAEAMAAMQSEFRDVHGQGSISENNKQTIALIIERMSQDDDRETRDTKQLSEMLIRIQVLERKGSMP